MKNPKWTEAQEKQLRDLQENKWWPFTRADERVLSWMHRQKEAQKNSTTEEALL